MYVLIHDEVAAFGSADNQPLLFVD